MTLALRLFRPLIHQPCPNAVPRLSHHLHFSTLMRAHPSCSPSRALGVTSRLVHSQLRGMVDRPPNLHAARYIINSVTGVSPLHPSSYIASPKSQIALLSTTSSRHAQPVKNDIKMPKDDATNHYIATHPSEVHNQIHPSVRQIPTLRYTLQNIGMSLASMAVSTASLLVTVLVILPLSLFRHLFVGLRGGAPAGSGNSSAGSKKVILIVGASRGIGFNVLKQYANDQNAVIVAASRSIGEYLRSLWNVIKSSGTA